MAEPEQHANSGGKLGRRAMGTTGVGVQQLGRRARAQMSGSDGALGVVGGDLARARTEGLWRGLRSAPDGVSAAQVPVPQGCRGEALLPGAG